MKKFLLGLLLLATPSFAALTEVDKSIYSERNLIANPGFENGKSGWLTSNATLTATTTAANVLVGTASGSVTISSNGGYVRTSTFKVPTGLYGNACEVSVNYRGGDALTTLEVYNRDNELLGSQTLTAHSTASPASAFFLCPTATQVAGDADKGFIYAQIKQTTAGTHTVLYSDSWYLGSLRGLVDTQNPDLFSAQVSDTGTVSNENVDFINGNGVITSTSTYTMTFNSGIFNVMPNCLAVATTTTGNTLARIDSVSSSQVVVRTTAAGAGTALALSFTVYCAKATTDTKLTSQVYKSIPRTADNTNFFAANISSTDVVTDENVDWINGNCTNATTGQATCTFNAGIFTATPVCLCTPISNAGDECAVTGVSSTSVTTFNRNSAGTAQNGSDGLICMKASADFKYPIVQPVVLGQFESGYSGVLRSFTAEINCDASSSITTSTLSGIVIGNRSTTTCALTLPTFFTSAPQCNFNVKGTTVQSTAVNVTSSTAVSVYGPSADYDGYLTCTGVK